MSSPARPPLSLLATIRLGLLNVTVGMNALLVFGVLNRVLISEWQINAALVGLFVCMHYVVCPMRTLAGYASDTKPLWGYRRTPYIVGGMAVAFGSLILILHSAQWIRTQPVWGSLACAVAFALWGLGLNTASVPYLALMSDLSGPYRARTISVAWFMMVAFGIVTTGIVIAKYFDLNLSKLSTDVTTLDAAALDQVLGRLFYTVVGISIVLAAVAIIGMEPRHHQAATDDETPPTLRETIAIMTADRDSKLFFAVITLGIFGVNAQDVLLEPYGAQVLQMSLADTTRLQPMWGGATLISMLLAGFILAHQLSQKNMALIGAVLSTLGLGLVIAAADLGTGMLRIGVFTLGMGNGIFAVGALSMMMDMTRPGQAATYLGVWGIAQAVAQGVAGLTAGVGRAGLELITGKIGLAYQGVFALEALALVATACLLLLMGRATPQRNQKRRDDRHGVEHLADAVSAS
ncbi:MAG: BCD family MFS transporter [Chloracidobacterium sp.]|uniref:BCD family MFS transporter n=1 Tax=Chloracidobacterium validum TaxID=2821543 RepID=A0ABX8B7X1_9BACT|nr:BCD family MFS transporter [Chloracidobacterium validum]QUW03054.1 BCD family MFS transporter [Chloracidobacterium validum]